MFRHSLRQASLVCARTPCASVARSSVRLTSVSVARRCAVLSNQHQANFSTAKTDEESHDDFKPIPKTPSTAASTSSSSASSSPSPLELAQQQIQADVTSHPVFLYMKGTPSQPRCGFSANVCRILNTYGVEFGSRDVLEDDNIREAIKKFSDWPTLPQLYVKGEFVGGSDIVSNMYKSGELDQILGAKPVKASA